MESFFGSNQNQDQGFPYVAIQPMIPIGFGYVWLWLQPDHDHTAEPDCSKEGYHNPTQGARLVCPCSQQTFGPIPTWKASQYFLECRSWLQWSSIQDGHSRPDECSMECSTQPFTLPMVVAAAQSCQQLRLPCWLDRVNS